MGKELLTPKFPARSRPQIKITGVDPSATRETVLQKLTEQNNLEFTEEQVTIRSIFPDRFSGTSTLALEMDPLIYKKLKEQQYIYLDWTRCPITEYFHVVRCSKCCQYGHTRQYCQADAPMCPRCGAEHEGRCNSETKCTACSKSNAGNGPGLTLMCRSVNAIPSPVGSGSPSCFHSRLFRGRITVSGFEQQGAFSFYFLLCLPLVRTQRLLPIDHREGHK